MTSSPDLPPDASTSASAPTSPAHHRPWGWIAACVFSPMPSTSVRSPRSVSLVVFPVVGVAGLRLRSESGSKAWLIVVTMLATAIVLTFFVIDTARNAPETFTAMLVMVALAVVLDAIWKRVRPHGPS